MCDIILADIPFTGIINTTEQIQNMEWTVGFSAKAGKQKTKLPANIDDRLAALVMELRNCSEINCTF